MKVQGMMILSLLLALLIAIFAVVNVETVEVNYIFGQAKWPLILIILGSVFIGATITGSLSFLRIYRLEQEIKQLKKQTTTRQANEDHQNKDRPFGQKTAKNK